MKFKLSEIAIGTKDLPWSSADILLGMGQYVETAIEYNNDFLVGQNLPKTAGIISHLYDVSNYEFLLENHLRSLKRDKLDILLLHYTDLPEKESWEEIKGYTDCIGLHGETMKKENLERYHEKYGVWPDYISIPLNPFEYKKELLDFAEESGVKVISYRIFGGPIEARKMLGTFGLQFLTRFAAYHSDIIVMSSVANLEEEMILQKTLIDLTGDTDFTDDSNYSPATSVNFPSEGTQRKVFTYSEVSISGKNHVFKNSDNGYLTPTELIISTDRSLEHIPTLDMDNIEEADNLLGSTVTVMADILQVEAPRWKEEVSGFYRYLVTQSLETIYSGYRYGIKITKVGQIFRFSVRDRLKFWTKPTEFVLVISERLDSGYNVFFRNL